MSVDDAIRLLLFGRSPEEKYRDNHDRIFGQKEKLMSYDDTPYDGFRARNRETPKPVEPKPRTKRLVWFKEDAPIPMSAVYLKERREGLTQRIVGEGRYEYDAYTEFLYEVYDEEKT